MKNNKVMAYIGWGMLMIVSLAAIALSEGRLSGVAVVWLMIGISHWRRASQNDRGQKEGVQEEV